MVNKYYNMMKRLFLSGFLLAALLLCPALQAQDFRLDAQLRPRLEYRDGYKTLSSENLDPALFISQRSRVGLSFTQPGLRAKVSFQNVRVWGDVPQLNLSDVHGNALHEAWGEFDLHKKLAVRVGRQEWVYDDARILGNVDWAQQGRSHDGLLFKFSPCEFGQVHLGLAWNQDAEQLFGQDYTVGGNYKAAQFLWLHREFGKFSFSFLFLNNGMPYMDMTDSLAPSQEIAFSQTVGPRFTYKHEKFKTNAALYFQGGKDAGNRDLSALYAAADISMPLPKGFAATLGFEYLSGTDLSGNGNTNKSFSPFYGTNHKFNGWMDYFYVGNHMNNAGLMDIYLSLDWRKDAWSLKLMPHFFSLAADVPDPDNAEATLDRGLGTELDFMAGYKLNDLVNISLGYSLMMGNETMQWLKGGDHEKTAGWGWLLLDIKPWAKME